MSDVVVLNSSNDAVVIGASTSVQVASTDSSAAGPPGPAGPPGDVGKVDTRAALAGVAGPAANASRWLAEGGREGIFVWQSSNQSANVTADPSQGVYVAPLSDTTGASGAWVRATGPNLWLNAEWFGLSTAAAGAANVAALTASLAAAAALGRRTVQIPPNSYTFTNTAVMAGDDLTIVAHGAELSSALTGFNYILHISGNRCKVHGAKFTLTASHQDHWMVEVSGTDCELDGVKFNKADGVASGKYFAYVRSTATGFTMRGGVAKNCGGIFSEASKASFIGAAFILQLSGGDDAIALKGIAVMNRNTRVVGCYFENAFAYVSIGSELGVEGANDAAHSKGVGQVEIIGNTGRNCGMILYVKPGAVAADYRDGLTEDINLIGNSLVDTTGLKLAGGVHIQASRGQWVRNIRGRGNTVSGRAWSNDATGTKALVHIWAFDTVGSSSPKIDNIDIGIEYLDPYAGAASGGASPGFPMINAAYVRDETSAQTAINSINLSIEADGISEYGGRIGTGLDNAVTFDKLILNNVGASGAHGGAHFSSIVILGEYDINPVAGADFTFAGTGALKHKILGTALAQPAADRIAFWDFSAAGPAWLQLGTNLTITGTTIDASGGGGMTDPYVPADGTMNITGGLAVSGTGAFGDNVAISKAGTPVLSLRNTTSGGGDLKFRNSADSASVGLLTATGASVVTLQGDTVTLSDVGVANAYLTAIAAQVDIKAANVTRLSITSAGAAVTGAITTYAGAGNARFRAQGAGGSVQIDSLTDSLAAFQNIEFRGLNLYFMANSVTVLTASSTGVAVTGSVVATDKIQTDDAVFARGVSTFPAGPNAFVDYDSGGSTARFGGYNGSTGWIPCRFLGSSFDLAVGTGGGSASTVVAVTTTGAAVTGKVSASTRFDLPSYTVAGLPAAGVAGGMIYVSNETGGAVPAFSDGTNWRRVTDRAIVA